jgi:Protein of unknown function (DUF3302)
MGLQVNSSPEWIYGLTLAVIFGLSIVAVFALYKLGGLPGRIARSRGHPRAAAIKVCGWLGLLVFFLWPIALLWAHKPLKRLTARSLTEEDLDALATGLRETSEQIATLEARLRVHSSKRVA